MRKILAVLRDRIDVKVVLPGWLFYLMCATLVVPAIYRILRAMLGWVL